MKMVEAGTGTAPKTGRRADYTGGTSTDFRFMGDGAAVAVTTLSMKTKKTGAKPIGPRPFCAILHCSII